MYKGSYNENGEYTGFYVEGIHENIQQPNIELTEEEWQQALSKNYKVINGKHTYSAFVESQDNIMESLRAIRNSLLTETDLDPSRRFASFSREKSRMEKLQTGTKRFN